MELVAEVARCRYGEPPLSTQSKMLPEPLCPEMHEDAKIVWRLIAGIVRRATTAAYPLLENLKEVVRRITEEEEAVRSARQLEEDLANEAKAQVNVCGGVMAAAETDDPDPAPMDVRDIDSTSTLSVQYPARAAGERPLGKDDFTI